MKTLFLLLCLILTVRIQAAITDKYVSSTAAGGGTGLTAGSPLTWTEMITAINAGTELGSRCVLAGTYTRAATDSITTNGSAVSPIIIRGYTTTIGDGYLGRTNTNGALILTNMPVIAYNSAFHHTFGNFMILESLSFTGLYSGALVTTGGDAIMRGCKVVNSSTNVGAQAITTASRVLLLDCDVELNGASGGSAAIAATTSANLRVVGCRIKGGPALGISVSTGSIILMGNTIFAGTGNQVVGLVTGSGVTAFYNTIVGGGADGVNFLTGTTSLQCLVGNMFTDNTGFGVNSAGATMAIVGSYNRFRSNTAGPKNNAADWFTTTAWGEVTSTTGDYVTPGSDYRLLSTSPAAGAALPQSASMGALQLPATSGGGGGSGINGSEILGIP